MGATASEKCQQEKRKTVNGEDILFAMTSLGFENYGEALKIYLARYREVSGESFFLNGINADLCRTCSLEATRSQQPHLPQRSRPMRTRATMY